MGAVNGDCTPPRYRTTRVPGLTVRSCPSAVGCRGLGVLALAKVGGFGVAAADFEEVPSPIERGEYLVGSGVDVGQMPAESGERARVVMAWAETIVGQIPGDIAGEVAEGVLLLAVSLEESEEGKETVPTARVLSHDRSIASLGLTS